MIDPKDKSKSLSLEEAQAIIHLRWSAVEVSSKFAAIDKRKKSQVF